MLFSGDKNFHKYFQLLLQSIQKVVHLQNYDLIMFQYKKHHF